MTADQAAMGKLTGDAEFETGGRPTRPQAKFATPLAGSKDLRRFASSVVMSALGQKPTSAAASTMSAKCHKRTSTAIQNSNWVTKVAAATRRSPVPNSASDS